MAINYNPAMVPQFSVYPKRKSSASEGADLYVRATYMSQVVEKSLGIRIPFSSWNTLMQQVEGDPVANFTLAQKLKEFEQKVGGTFFVMSQNGAEPMLKEIVDAAMGRTKSKAHSFFSVFEQYITDMVKLKGKGVSSANIQKHSVCLAHLRTYVHKKMNVSEIPFSRISREFIDGFVLYLKTDGGNQHNSAMKTLQVFKKIYRIAIDNRWVTHNAFGGYRISIKEVDRSYLTEEELAAIAGRHFAIRRLAFVKDAFLFACYSGLAHIDVCNLKRRDIETRYAGNSSVIKIRRAKTGVESIVPLFRPARDILDMWNPGWEKLPSEALLLPRISNQKINSYLKEIADMCGITKNLTFHIARHTFATTVTLGNNVPVETVSKMLGHTRISMTQRYAKVTELKIERDTEKLYNILNHE